MLVRLLHALVMVWILPVAAVVVIAVIELTAKDPVANDTPDWTSPLLYRQEQKPR